MLKTVLFDLDGSLLPMNQAAFTKEYTTRLARRLASRGYSPEGVVKSLWHGVGAMVKNTGELTNEEIFWAVFEKELGPAIRNESALFDDFYKNEFQEVIAVTSPSPQVPPLVAALKERGLRLVLATNPFFPRVATESRIRWAGLSPSDFSHVTYYENSHFCKPNPLYYREIEGVCGISPDTAIMVGNDVEEDMMARELGYRVFLLTDCLLNPKERDIATYPHGDFASLLAYIDTLL
ncbi:MAG: HAD family hydrolase [Clostridia bacterium]|nr:HAD family hydrolase [Clostridia bacterium]